MNEMSDDNSLEHARELFWQLYSDGEYADAEEVIKRIIEADPEDSNSWILLGITLEYQQKLVDAEHAYQEAITLEPENIHARDAMGSLLGQLSRFAEAERSFRMAIELDPRESDAWVGLAGTLHSQERYSESEDAYREAIRVDANNSEACRLLGIALADQNKLVEAEEHFLQATTIDPSEMDNWHDLAFVRSQQGDFIGAEQALIQLIRLDSHNSEALYLLGRCRLERGQFTEAAQALSDAANNGPDDSNIWYYLGDARYGQGDYPAAEQAYRQVTLIDPMSLEGWNNLAATLGKQSKWSEAESATQQAIRIDPNLEESRINLAAQLGAQGKHAESEDAALQALKMTARPDLSWSTWYLIAQSRQNRGTDVDQALDAYTRMSTAIERDRRRASGWELRLHESRWQAVMLQEAAAYCVRVGSRYIETALRFALQSKSRTADELFKYDPDNLRSLLSSEECKGLDEIGNLHAGLQIEQQLERMQDMYLHRSTGPTTKSTPTAEAFDAPNNNRERQVDLDQRRDNFLQQVVSNHPELEPFVRGPKSQRFQFSLTRLQKKLRPNEAVLEFLLTHARPLKLISILVTNHGLESHIWDQDSPMDGKSGISLDEWLEEELPDSLQIFEDQRANKIEETLTSDHLVRWGQVLFQPFVHALSETDRLWISSHSLLTELPFNAIPFPDGVEREVAIIPSAASLTRPLPKGPRPKPRFTLGVVAADAVEQAPLNLQSEEVRHLRGTVKSAKRRWELAGNRVGDEPTLANIQGKAGLTKGLVLSCHAGGPMENWGTIFLGSRSKPEPVTGKALVDSLLLGGRLRHMEVDLLITSACLTGQVDLERAEEWLGLPMALQSIWKTKAMLLTLWEVQELPAMIWVVELVKALTQGFSAGEAQKLAQGNLKSVNKGELEAVWLAEAQRRLPEEKWRRVDNQWRGTARSSGQYPFFSPVHWAPYILVGDPKVTISPSKPNVKL